MGQKVHPYGIRLGYTKPWKARWFSKKDYQNFLIEDIKVRDKAKKLLYSSGVASIDIERSVNRIRLKIHAARPGIIIGRKGQEIDKLRAELQKITDKEIFIDIKEVKNPQIHAQLVAENIAQQIERRVSYRKAMKKAVQGCMTRGGAGIKILCAGRLGGAEIARNEGCKEGKIPLSTFRANVDYGFTEARTTYGAIGIKVWIYTEGEMVEAEEAAQEKEDDKRRKSRRTEKKPGMATVAKGEASVKETASGDSDKSEGEK